MFQFLLHLAVDAERMGNPSEKDVEKANPDQAGWPMAAP